VADTLSVSVQISRASGGPLQLSNPGVYEVVAIGPGARQWRRHTVEGRYAHGRALVGAVLETMVVPVVVRVYGASWAQVSTRAKTLVDAVSQRSYTVTVNIDGVVSTWACEPADVSIVGGDAWQKFHAMARMQEYQLMIPRHPIPTSGGM
jgi:hypothetical protein